MVEDTVYDYPVGEILTQSQCDAKIYGWEDFQIQNCALFNQEIYGGYQFLFVMLIISTIFMFLSKKWGHLVEIKYVEMKFTRKHVKSPKIFNILKKLGLTTWYVKGFNIFSFIAFVAEHAMFFRIIQLFFNLKFRYGVI